MIVDNPHLAKPEVHSLDLTVETTGMTLTVNGGSFTMNSQNYLLDDDFNHEFPVTDYDRFVIGFLGKDKTSGDIVVLVQDIVEGSDSLGFNSADHDMLSWLFSFSLPANTSSLDNIGVRVTRYFPAPNVVQTGGE